MDAKELKPCPFCGSADVRIENFFDPYVACVCGANGNQTEDEDSAIAAWNRRAALPSDAAQAPEPDCWAILTPNGSRLVSPEEAKGRRDAYPLYAAPVAADAAAPSDTCACGYSLETSCNVLDPTCKRNASQPDERAACMHADNPKGCYRVRCQLGNKCVYDDMSPRSASENAARRALAATDSDRVALIHALQKALAYWMPKVFDDRSADDAYLLVGYEGETEQRCWGDEMVAALPRWTPVGESLPIEPGWYLAMLKSDNDWGFMSDTALQVEFDAYTNKPKAFTCFYEYHGNEDITDAVTHWMPMPPKPVATASHDAAAHRRHARGSS